MSKPATTINPEIVRAIKRLRELRWDVHANQDRAQLVVSCQKGQFGFNVFEPTVHRAWLAAVKKAEDYERS